MTELEKRIDELVEKQRRDSLRIRELARRAKATEACEAWRNSHADTPGARHVIAPMFLKDGNVVAEPSPDDLKKAQKFEDWWDTTVAPILNMQDDEEDAWE